MDVLFLPSILALGGMGLLFGAGLAFAAKKFAVQVDPRVTQILEILPGANCGSCGRPGCSAYAEAVVNGSLPPNRCTPGGKDVAERISSILGLSGVEMEEPRVAVVRCQGGKDQAVEKFIYEGIHDCSAAALIGGGHKSCQYGCLGLGSCVRACPFDAMYMNDNGLPVVIEDKCTACGICVSTCPRGIMQLISRNQNVFLGCVSQEKLKAVKSVCSVGCFACKICTTPKVTPSEAIIMEGNLPVIKNIQSIELYEAAKKCPAGCYVIRDKSKIPFVPEQVEAKEE